MTLKVLSVFIIFSILLIVCDCKTYLPCEFASALKKEGITNRKQLGTWTCIAKYESNFNTKAINSKSGDYGILQINSKYWCSTSSTAGKGCNIRCSSLLGDSIRPDVTCAKKIYAETKRISGDGFTAWVVYKKYCLGDQTKWISKCKL
ncbi:hypothetical protein ABEB36_010198 [Hypothenemus hampei]|uniref:lysozyme n=1 Tax=Hypothenemus hampei TaxID=57062 RepID=A0ABD1EIV0_HYPHA